MKVFPLYIFAILICLSSCNSFKALKAKAKPAYFSGSNEIFEDTVYPEQAVNYFRFPDLKGNMGESIELLPGSESKVLIQKPTLFFKENDLALVYPDEHIIVSGGYDDYTFSTVNHNRQRDAELKLFKVFRRLEQYPSVPRLTEYDLQTVFDLEKEQRNKIPIAEARSQRIFDSLTAEYKVSGQFRKFAGDFIKDKYDVSLLILYNLYGDTLKSHGLYKVKLKELLPDLNSISNKSDFNSNIRHYLNEVHSWLFTDNLLWSLPDVAEFKKCFDTIESNFKNLPRDYLLSRLMWRAYSKGLDLPVGYEKKYRHYSKDRDYKRVVNKTKRERRRTDRDQKGIENQLLLADGKTVISLEEVLANYKGKFVLIDLWGSWCMPCIRQIPYLKQLETKYSKDKIAFISISLDNQTKSWHRAMRTTGVDTTNNYLLLNANRTSFCKTYDINVIPRFLLIDPNGKVINDNTPLPADDSLVQLLDGLITK
jgi:thiol-disulfide isomerase/thioredoxin